MHAKELKEKVVYARLYHLFMFSDSAHTFNTIYREIFYNYDIDLFSEYRIRKTLKDLENNGVIKKHAVKGREIYYKRNKIESISFNKKEKSIINSLDSKMTFGVEIEFASLINGLYLRDMIREMGITNTKGDFSQWFGTKSQLDYANNWHLTTDGSVTGSVDSEGFEIISPILNKNKDIIDLKKILWLLFRFKKLGLIEVDHTCGVHVHHGGFERSIAKMIDIMVQAQPVLNTIVKKDRAYSKSRIQWYEKRDYENKKGQTATELECEYCMPIIKENYYIGDRIDYNHSRYYNFRINNYKTNGTIEIRQLEGTLKFNKIIAWTCLVQHIIKASKNKVSDLRQERDTRSFFEFIDLPRAVANYFRVV